MKQKRFLYIIIFILIVSIGVFYISINNAQKDNSPLTTEVYTVSSGYGYKIKLNNTILIQQAFIPAISGKKSFKTRTQAQIIANLVVQKLLSKAPPTVTVDDLKNNQINIQ